MNREGHESVRFFIGTEVEHLPTLKRRTLFVVGLQPVDDIIEYAKEEKVEAIYFGANQSFALNKDETLYDAWRKWEEMIMPCLEEYKYWCVLDLDVKYAEQLCETTMVGHSTFIPVLSVKLPYINQLGYHAHLKLDDTDFQATNPGVWVHRIHNLMDERTFTTWSDYLDDKTL
jgi:hypothetical protein